MRALVTLTLPMLLVLAAPAQAQMQSQSQSGRMGMDAGTDRVDPSRAVEASDVTPSPRLVGKPIAYRDRKGTAGTIRDVVTGDDGRPKLVMQVKETGRNVVLDMSEVRRQGNAIQLMIEPEQIATLLPYQPQGGMGNMGRSSPNPMGGAPMGGTGR